MSKLYVQMESVQQPKKPLLRLLPRHGTNAFLSDGGLFLFCCRNASQEKKAHLLSELLWRRVSMTVKQMLEYWNLSGNSSTAKNVWLYDKKADRIHCIHRITEYILNLIKAEEVATTEMFDGRMYITINKSLDELRAGK